MILCGQKQGLAGLPATQITMPQTQPYFLFNPHSKLLHRKTVATVVFDNKEIKVEMLNSPRSQAKLGFLPGLASEPALLSGKRNVAWVLFQRRSHQTVSGRPGNPENLPHTHKPQSAKSHSAGTTTARILWLQTRNTRETH